MFLSVDGMLIGEELRGGVAQNISEGRPRTLVHGFPFHDDGRTWLVTKMWGRNTEPTLEQLAKLAPDQSGIGYEAVR